ncbi:TetR/AcrR family transcriptional regulator [Propionimicrobium sp. PCR01-08-3]|uniref:TetR/AcrR family transcriptional regulator n=1 Tax=Propionimicrobium sp. PCR01-08-3 TaxID=3052086 RepID=UPI00255C5EB9|nr:TetR/AcrR family transcriptional regulator [Propionimicrobium sp. PCR01-08-3]WIY83952.1 hypothetical protein QQ658_06320 [Propionimicrobium sp. PCR01-08-3]
MSRRQDIASAAIELVAEGGSHALTHRKIDRRLGLPQGTTSNYAKTRRALVRMVVDEIAALADIRGGDQRALPTTVAEAVDQLVPALDATIERGVDTRARMALSIDYLQDDELHRLLTTDSPVRTKLLTETERMLTSLGVPEPDRRAVDFIGIMNGLLYDRLAGNGVRGEQVDARNVLTAWLTGIGGRQ